jgi:polyphosphate kinase 2 (PPK2 family)
LRCRSVGPIGIFNRSYHEEWLVVRVHPEIIAGEKITQAAYQEVIRHTSSEAAPWHVVPADHKWFARVVIGSTIVSALEKLDLQFPKVDPASLQEFKQVRKALLAEGRGGEKAAAGKAAKK